MLTRIVVAAALALAVLAPAGGAGPAGAEPAAAPPPADWIGPAAGLGRPEFTARLVTGGTDSSDPSVVWLGLQVRLGPGWHTYWRSAGDAGAPPEFDWSGSANVADVTVEWPAPRRITVADFDSFGYEDEVVFPVRMRRADPQASTRVSLSLALYVCATICTRNDLRLDTVVPPGEAASADAELITAWRRKVPARDAVAGLSIGALSLEREPPRLRAEVRSSPPLVAADAFVDGDDAIAAGRPQFTPGDGGVTVLTLPLDGLGDGGPTRPLRLTLVDGARAVEAVLAPVVGPAPVAAAAVVPPASAPAAPVSADGVSLVAMLLAALLGGLVLNVMPCVFPVLSLKLLALAGHGAEPHAVRRGLVASALGVVASFLVLAGVLAALKAAGAQIGWGIQFQQPVFLIAMAIVLALFAANLLGLFEVRLPMGLAGVAGRAGGGHGPAAQFANGAVMTLLATPCSAPFVGTAVGFALARGPAEIVAVFAALGLGMAAPQLVLAAVPRLARRLPRPGPWLDKVRPVAAVALLGTAAWLLVVVAEIAGAATALTVAAVLTVALLAAGLWRGRLARVAAASLAAALVGVVVLTGGRLAPAAADAPQAVEWRPFAPEAVQAAVRSGRTVLVDVTASWCITCKVNEALILDSAAIRRRLGTDVVPIKGDWTRPDPVIAAYLGGFGRYGLPFNAVFGPGAPDGIVLPELLTTDAVLAAFDRAATPALAERTDR
ncbi:Thiol:disulfide interchange protein DsbD [Rhodoplanes serenus]|uniref:Thiol:disulfide interchange protein DsbD n=1 Tax=Rhodoplanes serenus TaxID=200615 RepID=A0A3S4B3L7_9BRAD|nr:protein-disulfide reductase DsbD domain-containing protein [Rhodoplanes serenus]VCU08277.1 Thiol:disulfide interchange protein DsbD [Rhodoplanes serenus]